MPEGPGSDSNGVDLVVFRVGSHKADVNDACVVVDLHYQPVVVSFDVKDYAIAREDVCRRIASPDVLRLTPGILAKDLPNLR